MPAKMSRRTFLSSAAVVAVASVLSEPAISWATTSTTAGNPTGHSRGDVRRARHGARCDRTNDDTAAIDAAFAAMRDTEGHPAGTLHIPGDCRTTSTLDFDCGYASNPASDSVPATGGSERFVLACDGLVPDAGVGTAIRLHHGYNVDAFVRFVGGGQSDDVGLYVDALSGCHIDVEAQQFRGTVLRADGANGIATSRNWSLNVQR